MTDDFNIFDEIAKVKEVASHVEHRIVLNDTGMAVVIAGLTMLLEIESAQMSKDERLLVSRMLADFRKGLGDARNLEAPRLQ